MDARFGRWLLLLLMGITVAVSSRAHAQTYPRYDRIQMNSPHNSFQKWQDPHDMLTFYNIRSMEWDVHAAGSDTPNEWVLFHRDAPLDKSTHCWNLEDCVRQIKGFHDFVPQHEVITIYLDEGEDDTFTSYAQTSAMDGLLESVLGRSALFTPSDLLASCSGHSTLGGVVQDCSWPTTDTLRGKFIFITDAKTYGDKNVTPQKAQYSHDLFYMPDWSCSPNGACPNGNWTFTFDSDVVMYNFDNSHYGHDTLTTGFAQAHAAHRVVRAFQNDSSGTCFPDMQSAGANMVASDGLDDDVYGNRLSWNTVSPTGWPFSCVPGFPSCDDYWSEPTNRTFQLESETGGGGGLFLTRSPKLDTIQSLVGLPYTHNMQGDSYQPTINLSGFACVMARATTNSSGHYFAVCRGNDTGPAFMRFNDGSVVVTPATSPASGLKFYGVPGGNQQNQYTWGRVKIELQNNTSDFCGGTGVRALAWTCRSGNDCAFIGDHHFCGDTLPVRGTYVQNAAATFTNTMVSEARVLPSTSTQVFLSSTSLAPASSTTLDPNSSPTYFGWGDQPTTFTKASGVHVANGSWWYPDPVFTPQGALFFTDLTGTGNADLYARPGNQPTTSSYDCRGNNGGSLETCEDIISGNYPYEYGGAMVFPGVYGVSGNPTVTLKTAVLSWTPFSNPFELLPAASPNGTSEQIPAPPLGTNCRIGTVFPADVAVYVKAGALPNPSSYDAFIDTPNSGVEALYFTTTSTQDLFIYVVNKSSLFTIGSLRVDCD
jgi:Phosphoinositide phospholipase C, Ca2+-dependent